MFSFLHERGCEDMVSLLLKRTIYSSVSLHIGDVKEKPDGFGVRIFTTTQSCSLTLVNCFAK